MPRLSDFGLKNLKGKASEPVGSRGDGALLFKRRTGGVIEAYYRYRFQGTESLIKIGQYKQIKTGNGFTLAECRKVASGLANTSRDCGGDLKTYLTEQEQLKQQKKEQEQRAAIIEAKRGTLADLIRTYIELLQSKGKTSAEEVRKTLERDVTKPFPGLAATKARDLTPDDIVTILAKVYQRGAKVQANRLRSYLHAAFAYGLKADYDFARIGDKRFGLTINPVSAVPKQGQHERALDRFLDHGEVCRLWHTFPDVDRVGVLIVACIRFLIATAGQRPRQLLRVPWTDYDMFRRTVTIYDTKGKGGRRKHVVPLTKRAIEILEEIKPITGGYTWPFSTHGKTPIHTDSLKTATERYTQQITDIDNAEGHPLPVRFTPRDLRRTCKNLLIDAGVNRESRNLLQSHGQTGVDIEHYDRSEHMEEKRKAIGEYDRLLTKVLEGKQTKLVDLNQYRVELAK